MMRAIRTISSRFRRARFYQARIKSNDRSWATIKGFVTLLCRAVFCQTACQNKQNGADCALRTLARLGENKKGYLLLCPDIKKAVQIARTAPLF
tara:strand:- start:1056 stop:1337 length:282 start_codon:yes stop_codon:yes gene_type:complete